MALAARIFGLLALALATSACAQPGQTPTTAAVDTPVLASPANGEPQLLAYKVTPTRTLNLHIFAPDQARFPGTRPAVVIFHGGGWNEGKPQRFYDQARQLSEKGMVAIAAEYRLSSVDGTGPDSALFDAKSAMRFVRANAKTFGIDPQRIVALGGSAGGHLAAALATAKGFNEPTDDVSISTQPAALVLFNPVIDNGPDGYGHDRVKAYWRDFSPLHNIAPDHPPTLILLGTRDNLIPVATGESYCEKVRAVGSDCTLILYEGQPHAFYNRSRSERYYRETLEATDAFLAALGYF